MLTVFTMTPQRELIFVVSCPSPAISITIEWIGRVSDQILLLKIRSDQIFHPADETRFLTWVLLWKRLRISSSRAKEITAVTANWRHHPWYISLSYFFNYNNPHRSSNVTLIDLLLWWLVIPLFNYNYCACGDPHSRPSLSKAGFYAQILTLITCTRLSKSAKEIVLQEL